MESTTKSKITRRRSSSGGTISKVGMDASIFASEKEKLIKSYYNRRKLLAVPEEILKNNKDKHFYWERVDKIQKSAGYHEKGYQLFRTDSKSVDIDNQFGAAPDNLVHRNEMVLMWMPKDEFNLMQLEREVAEGKRDIGDVIRRRADMAGFKPTSVVESRYIQNSGMED